MNMINAIVSAFMAVALLWMRATQTTTASMSAARPVLLVLALLLAAVSVASLYAYIKDHKDHWIVRWHMHKYGHIGYVPLHVLDRLPLSTLDRYPIA